MAIESGCELKRSNRTASSGWKSDSFDQSDVWLDYTCLCMKAQEVGSE